MNILRHFGGERLVQGLILHNVPILQAQAKSHSLSLAGSVAGVHAVAVECARSVSPVPQPHSHQVPDAAAA